MKIILAALAVALIALAWRFLKGPRSKSAPEPEEEPLISLVLLLADPLELDDEGLARKVEKAFDLTLDPEDEDADAFVLSKALPPHVEKAASFLVKLPERAFLVHAHARPYVKDPEEFARSIADGRLRKVMARHRAWLAVDLLGEPPGPEDNARAYAAMGRLTAEFSHPTVLGIYSTQYERLNEWEPGIAEKLRGENPLEIFGEPTFAPVYHVARDDPRMAAAVKEARESFPEFASAFAGRSDPEQPFIIKARFQEGEKVEYMWVLVTEIRGQEIRGTLENIPNELVGPKKGDVVRVPVAELNDWVYARDDQERGGFTLKVLAEASRR